MNAEEIASKLAEPFPADAIGWKPQSVAGNRALAVAYVDARDVMDRLDAVVGIDGWQDTYETLADGTVVCSLSVKVGEVWLRKCDVGGQSDQKDAGDKHKSAFSDALKRAAVKYGIGRYIYRLPLVWCDYDPQKKQLTKTPTLPEWALPAKPKGDAKTIAAWEARLKHDRPLAEINGMVGDFAQMDLPTKTAVWSLLKKWAERTGLLWDKERKEFFVPEQGEVA